MYRGRRGVSLMSQKHFVRVVRRIGDLTEFRDRNLMDRSLVKTVAELLPGSEVALYDVKTAGPPLKLLLVCCEGDGLGVNTAEETLLPEVLSDAILNCINTGKVMQGALGPARLFAIYPVRGGRQDICSLLVQTGKAGIEESREFMEGLLRIHHNYLLLLDESQRDKLTGLLNRKTFDSEIGRIISQPLGPPKPSPFEKVRKPIPDEQARHWLGILDIDHFKGINDEYGHVFGDEVLILIARILNRCFRENDIIFRYGGEEFVVVLRVLARKDADIAFKRLRRTIENYDFPQVGRVTVSMGTVEIHPNDVPASVVGHADQALYYAKRTGRNRACALRTATDNTAENSAA